MQIVNRKISELIPYVNNARKNDQAVDAVASSIKNYGFKQPIVIDSQGEVIAGHTRLKASQKLGLDEVPCIIADDLTPAQVKAYRIADNKVAELSEWDYELLKLELEDIEGFTGFEVEELEDLFEDEKQAKEESFDLDEALNEVTEPITKRGWIYKLGNHRLLCGDSTSEADVARLMNGQKADLLHTDPPYNVNYNNQNRPKAGKNDLGTIKNDKMDDKSFYIFLLNCFNRAFENLKENATCYIWHASSEVINFTQALIDAGFEYKQQIIWVKPMLLGRSKYQWAHEPCLFGVKGSPYFTDDRTKTTVWNFGGYDKSKNVHPTQKPIFIPLEAIQNSSKKNDLILDLFGGSGSTLIACEQTNRSCYMMELDEKYCDVIVKRWEDYTGLKAERIE